MIKHCLCLSLLLHSVISFPGPTHPYALTSVYGSKLLAPNTGQKGNSGFVKQRILSAKVLKVKELKNELAQAQTLINVSCLSSVFFNKTGKEM